MTREMLEKFGTVGATLEFLRIEVSKINDTRQCNKDYYLDIIDETMAAVYELGRLLECIHD